jgi:hypothetical protein
MRHETFATPGPVEIEVRVPAGRVELETAETAETRVELAPFGDDDDSLAAVQSARIELRERATGGQQVLVAVENAGRALDLSLSRGLPSGLRHFQFGILRRGEVLARVRCPHGTSVDAEGGSTEIEARGRFGSVTVSTRSGDVDLAEIERDASVHSVSGDVRVGIVAGKTRVETASGDVAVRGVGTRGEINSASGDVLVDHAPGPITVNSASGDVVVRRADSSVAVNTASGDQRIDGLAEGEVSLRSASGDIRVSVRPGTKLWLDAHSRTGETTSDMEVGSEPPGDRAPSLELRATSLSGDIHIERVPA